MRTLAEILNHLELYGFVEVERFLVKDIRCF